MAAIKRGERAIAAVGLAAVTLAGIITFAAGLAGFLSFFGQGVDEAFRRWTDQALLAGGAVAMAAGAAGLAVEWRVSRPAARLSGVAAALLAGVVAVAAGLGVWHARSEPQGKEHGSLEHLMVPSAAIADQLTTGSLPSGDAAVAGPPGQGPPVAVRSWRPGDCAALNRAILRWADSGSVRVPAGFVPGAGTPGCLWFANYRGWPVRAEVFGNASAGQSLARVIIAPPGVGL